MKFLCSLITAIAVMFGGMAFVAPAAHADPVTPPPGCVTTGTSSDTEVVLEACTFAVGSESASVSAVVRATVEGKTQLSFVNPNAKAWTLQRARGCKLITVKIAMSKQVIRKKLKGERCVRLSHGSTWANSGKRGLITVPFMATVRGKFSLMVARGRTGTWEHRGEFANGRFTQVCGNDWKIGVKPPLTDDDVVIVRSEDDVIVEADVTGQSSGSVTVSGSLECPSGTLTGSATVQASGSLSIHLRVKASVMAKAIDDAKAQAMASARASARASYEVQALASIHLTCSNTPPTTAPPSITNVEQPNDVLVNNTRTIRVRGFVPAGQTATLSASAQYGTITSGDSQSVSGTFDLTVTYAAPSEVPPGGNDTVSFALFNADGQGETKSVTFEIRPAPIDPL